MAGQASGSSGLHPGLTSDDKLPSPGGGPPSQVTAGCHCGHISLELPAPPAKTNECRCSVCYRYGALWAYYPEEEVNVLVNVPDRPPAALDRGAVAGPPAPDPTASSGSGGLRSYVRGDGHGRIAFCFCGRCGCLTHWAPTEKFLAVLRGEKEEEGAEHRQPRVGVNARMLPPGFLENVEREVGQFEDFY